MEKIKWRYKEHNVKPASHGFLICTDCKIMIRLNGKNPFTGILFESEKAFHYRPDGRQENTFLPCRSELSSAKTVAEMLRNG